MKTNLKHGCAAAAFAITALLSYHHADACTRVLYEGSDSLKIVGRSLDWKTPIPTNLYVYPAGMTKQGSDKENCLTWTSKYGAVYAVSYDGGITEGMNEKGLTVNGLFCKGTIYSNPATEGNPSISLAVFVGWLLDTCATTDEVQSTLENTPFSLGGASFDQGTVSTLHWGVSDPSGKSIIFEFDNGVLKIHDMGDYRAMTNDPQWTQMTAIIDYWNKVGGQHMMPGTVTSPDRCVRANYFAHHVNKTGDADLGLSITRSILQQSSVPYTYMIEGEPNLSSTQWRSYANMRDVRYYFDIVTMPSVFYIDLNKCNLRKGASVLKLDTSKEKDLYGDITSRLHKSAPFEPMY